MRYTVALKLNSTTKKYCNLIQAQLLQAGNTELVGKVSLFNILTNISDLAGCIQLIDNHCPTNLDISLQKLIKVKNRIFISLKAEAIQHFYDQLVVGLNISTKYKFHMQLPLALCTEEFNLREASKSINIFNKPYSAIQLIVYNEDGEVFCKQLHSKTPPCQDE